METEGEEVFWGGGEGKRRKGEVRFHSSLLFFVALSTRPIKPSPLSLCSLSTSFPTSLSVPHIPSLVYTPFLSIVYYYYGDSNDDDDDGDDDDNEDDVMVMIMVMWWWCDGDDDDDDDDDDDVMVMIMVMWWWCDGDVMVMWCYY